MNTQMLKTIVLSGFMILSISPIAKAEDVTTCKFMTATEATITDTKCSVEREGRLDSQYKGNRTSLPEKMTIRWSDGVTTKIEFKAIFEINGGLAYGAVSIDGHIYRFVRSGDGKGLTFETLDPDMKSKKIDISYSYS